ncbi:MAG TPA: hypothetical protein VII94_05915 [Candidatus Saccharimonadales bacterium]
MKVKTLQEEASQYSLSSLLELQQKRQQNVQLFEQAIKNERAAGMQEAAATANLEEKLQFYNAKLIKLSEEDRLAIVRDIPKLKSTQEKRKDNIINLQKAILEEQNTMDHETQMIMFLEKHNGIQK